MSRTYSQRERIAAARRYHRQRGIPDELINVIAIVLAIGVIVGALVLVNVFDSGAKDNITCKQTNGTQYWLCIANQAARQYVSYSVWNRARVGGYYDEGSHSVFRDVSEDPAAPHGFLHGITEHGGFGEGHGGGGHGGGGR